MNTHLPHSWPSNSRIPRTSALSSSSPSSNSAHHSEQLPTSVPARPILTRIEPALRRLRVLPERRQRREVDRPLAQLDSLALVCIAHDLLRITRVQRRDERRVCQQSATYDRRDRSLYIPCGDCEYLLQRNTSVRPHPLRHLTVRVPKPRRHALPNH